MSQSPTTLPVAPTDDPSASKPSLSDRLSSHPQIMLGIVLVALILITGIVEPNYLSAAGLRNSLVWAIPIGILAAGQTILMLTGGIDLSIAMIATASAFISASQTSNGPVVSIAIGLAVGIIAGAANGVGVGVFRVNPLIMTMAMASILLGLFTGWATTIFAGSHTVHDFIITMGRRSFFGNIPWAGDNAIAARLSGIRAWQVLVVAYALSGLLGAIAGLLMGGRIGSVDLQLAGFLLLPSVAAAVIGGTSIFGGVGTYSGTILGALILGVLQSLLTFLGAGQAVQQILYGTIIVGLSWMYSRLAASQ